MFEEIYYKELAHKIREIEKSHDLPMTSSRLRNACGVIQSEFRDLKTKGANGTSISLNPKGSRFRG